MEKPAKPGTESSADSKYFCGRGLVSVGSTTFLLESTGALKNDWDASSKVYMYSGHHHTWNLSSGKCPILKARILETRK